MAAGDVALTELLEVYERRTDRSRAITAQLDLDGPPRASLPSQGRTSLRCVLVRMLEETARHNGHLDLLRESTDGVTGE